MWGQARHPLGLFHPPTENYPTSPQVELAPLLALMKFSLVPLLTKRSGAHTLLQLRVGHKGISHRSLEAARKELAFNRAYPVKADTHYM